MTSNSSNLVARLNLPNMRYPTQRKVEVYAQAVRGLTELEQDPEKQLKYQYPVSPYFSFS